MPDARALTYTVLETPLGPLLVAAAGEALVAVTFGGADLDAPVAPVAPVPPVPPAGAQPTEAAAGVLAEARAQLGQYFAGTRTAFDLPLAAAGTAFQQRVWDALRRVPYGATASYADVARALGDPKATRAVGAANGRNPLAVLVPCHRVVGSGGALTGYAGGMGRKRWLLRHEAAHAGLAFDSAPFGESAFGAPALGGPLSAAR